MRYVVRHLPIKNRDETGMAYINRLEKWLNARAPLELVAIVGGVAAVFLDRRNAQDRALVESWFTASSENYDPRDYESPGDDQ